MLRVGIFFGGSSSEREVSLEGGRNVFYKLDPVKYERKPIFVDARNHFWLIPESLIIQNTTDDITAHLADGGARRILYEDLPQEIDFAFLIGHGHPIENGCVQGLLEVLRIPYNGPGVLGAALGMDKLTQRTLYQGAGIDVPKTIHLFYDTWGGEKSRIAERIQKEIGFPCVVKPRDEGCSTGIYIVRTAEELAGAATQIFLASKTALIEELLNGMEVTVSVLGNEDVQVLPPTETPKKSLKGFLTLEEKFLPGGAEMITPARLPQDVLERIKDTARRACAILGVVGYPRVDMFVTGDRIVILEINTLPGITPSTMVFHQAAEIGLSPSRFLDRIIELGLAAHKNKKGPL